MRQLPWYLASVLTLAALGCAGGNSPVDPATPAADALPTPVGALSASAGLGTPVLENGLIQTALAIYTIEIDPHSLQAAASLKQTRQAQATDDVYFLSIDSFLRADSLRVTGVASTATTIDLSYSIAHPFPAPNNITGTPNGSTNRADLGIAGMSLFLADVPTATGNTWFTNRVAATDLVTNADAYYSPAGLLSVTGTANTFPYKQLVDESGSTGSRLEASNSGTPTGNFGSDGWTRAEFGAGNNGWTGYGVLHQGQTSVNTVSLDRDALAGGFSLDLAVIAKYNDPRGGTNAAQKKANRLPPSAPNASLFAYRMPHGALDVSRIVYQGEGGGFLVNAISGSELRFHVEDWDARATETAAPDLADDPSFTNVAQGESGVPLLAVSIPGVIGDATTVVNMTNGPVDDDTAYGGDAAQDSGQPGDALFFAETVSKTVTSGQTVGNYVGMVRATDAETPSTAIPLNANTLLPLTSNFPEPVSYQAFTVALISGNDPPTATVNAPGAAVPSGNGVLALTINPYNDPDADTIQIQFDWNNDGDFDDPGEGYQNLDGTPPDVFNAPIFYSNATLTPETRTVPYQYTDGFIPSPITGSVDFTLGPNQAPQVTGSRTLQNASVMTPAIFVMTAGTGTAVDPEGDAITYSITNNVNSEAPTSATFPFNAHTTPFTLPPVLDVAFTVRANDALHAGTSGTAYPVVNGTLTTAAPHGWVFAPSTQATGAEAGHGVAVAPNGNVYVLTDIVNNSNFGGGALTVTSSPGIALVALNASGSFLWNRAIDAASGGFDDTLGIGVDSSSNVVIYGYWRGTIDLGFGSIMNNQSVSTSNYDVFVAKYSPTGTPLWQLASNGDGSGTGITEFQEMNGLAVNPVNNDIVITGRYNRTETWGSVSLVTNAGPTATSYDPFVVCINSAGVPLWGQDFVAVSTAQEIAMAAAYTPTGAVIVGGVYRTGMDFGGGARVADAGGDGYVVRLDGATGAYVWDYVFDGTGASNQEFVNGISADATRVYATGRFYNTTDFGGGVRTAAGTTSASEPFIVALDALTGAYLWDRAITGSTSSEQGRDVHSTGTAVYAVGDWFTGADFGGGARTGTSTSSEGYLIRLDPATGVVLWETLLGGSGTDAARSVAANAAGEPIMTGSYTNLVDFDPGPTLVNRQAASTTSADLFVARYLAATGIMY